MYSTSFSKTCSSLTCFNAFFNYTMILAPLTAGYVSLEYTKTVFHLEAILFQTRHCNYVLGILIPLSNQINLQDVDDFGGKTLKKRMYRGRDNPVLCAKLKPPCKPLIIHEIILTSQEKFEYNSMKQDNSITRVEKALFYNDFNEFNID